MNSKEIMELYDEHVINVYNQIPIVLDKGHGAVLYDVDGNRYIDFFSGVAVNNVGQTCDRVVEAIKNQASKMIHCSNIYYNEPAAVLAEKLTRLSGFDKVFFSNSGAEANECAIKLVRKYSDKHEIIATNNSFHGRTMLTLTMTGNEKYKNQFKPLPSGFKHVNFGDIDELKESITEDTSAIVLELIQGEIGVKVASQEYFDEVQSICDENDILLVIDEVQTGFGRTGELFAFNLFNLKPDIVTLAKGLGGGVPIGATLTTNQIASCFSLGDHGSTFGGNPLAAAAANATLDVLVEENLCENSKKMGDYFKKELLKLKSKYSQIIDVRGYGLMIGVELDYNASIIVDGMLTKGFLINSTGNNVLRLVPPLIITKTQIDDFIKALDEIFLKL